MITILFNISILLDVQANLPVTSPFFVCPNGFDEHLFQIIIVLWMCMVPKYPSAEMYSCSNVPCQRIHMLKSSRVEKSQCRKVPMPKNPNAEISLCRNVCGAEKYPCRKIHMMK